MQGIRILTAGALILALAALTGCGGAPQEESVTGPEETVSQETTDQIFEIELMKDRENISVTVQQVQLVRDADFGEGRASDALVLSLSVDNQNNAGLQLHPDSGRIVINTGEEVISPKGIFRETYPNGTLKQGDLYFPLKLTRLNEINSIRIILEGPVNQYYEMMGEEYIFEIALEHPNFEPVSRETVVERAYENASQLTEASGVSESHHLGIREEIGPLTVHVMDLIVYEQVEHPFADFLNLEEPVNLIGLTITVENEASQTVYHSNARGRLVSDDGQEFIMDQLMSQYMNPEYHPGAIKSGTSFFRVDTLEDLIHDLKIRVDGAWERIGNESELLEEGRIIDLSVMR